MFQSCDRRLRTADCHSRSNAVSRRRSTVRNLSRIFLVLGILITGLTITSAVQAQDSANPVIDQLQVDLWPEYDDPRLLVIYKGILPALPEEPLRLPIPAAADVHAVAFLGDEDRLITLDWEATAAGDQQIIAFTPRGTNFQVEYYADVIGGGPDKSFTVTIDVGAQTVNDLAISVQQPAGASNLQGEPALSGPVVGFQGLSFYTRDVGSVEPGQTIQQTVSYTKASDALTVQQIDPPVSEAVTTQPTAEPADSAFGTNLSGRSVGQFWLPVGATVVILAGLALIGVGAWRARQASVEPAQTTRRPRQSQRSRPRRAAASEPAGEGPAQYCHRCGAPFEPDDQFCAECGAPRRGLV